MSTQTPPKVGLSEANTSLSAPRHKDLFLEGMDPATAKKEKCGQARVLGLGFFVMFGVVITGLSFTFNGAWKPGHGVNFRSLTNEQLPGWDDEENRVHKAASLAWRQSPPALAAKGSNQATPATSFDLAYDDKDDVEPKADESPVRVYVDGKLVGTAYFPKSAFPSDAKTETVIGLPNREPQPARKSFIHAYREAKLLRMLPTRYVLYVGCVLGLMGLLIPFALVPFYDFWMRYVTAPLGWFNTRLILTILWFVIFTPMAIFRRLLSGDPLRRAQLPKDQTYWLEKKQRDPKHFQKGF
jgi:saxitoxin biosynthesis operon SxtJ-like protein